MGLSTEYLRVTGENRSRNFPVFREVMNFEETQQKMGRNFADIMREVYGMEDAFGLCGIISVHAGSILTTGYGRDFSYSPRRYKEIFDDAVANSKPQAYDFFAQQYFPKKTFDELAITDTEQMRHTLRSLKPNQGLLINVMCHYPKQQGEHTHYLAAKFAGSIGSVPQGMVEVLKRVAGHAELVKNGQVEKARDPLELLYIIDPDLRRDEAGQELTRIMGEIRSDILK